jgi:3-oxoacyl-[acyl-carrier protein] reductase
MSASLSQQTALVTGASRGIGRAIALELARQGAHVIGTATSDTGASDISQYFAQSGLSGSGVVLQVTDTAGCEALFNSIVQSRGSIDILVNNAGITQDQLAVRMKDDEWDSVVAVNLTAVFRLCKLAMRPMMKARHGRMINITSVVGSSGNAGQSNYAATKAGVAGMTRSLARELGSRNITVNCVAPGFIETDMTRALNPEQVALLEKQIALGRFGKPEDIAQAVAFLASPGAAYITGTTLHVNGGMYMAA